MSGLDFPHTCPKIDRAIRIAKDTINSYFVDVLTDASPLLGEDRINELAGDLTDKMYSDLEDIFEGVRDLNSEIRRQAERQISDLEDELRDARSMIE